MRNKTSHVKVVTLGAFFTSVSGTLGVDIPFPSIRRPHASPTDSDSTTSNISNSKAESPRTVGVANDPADLVSPLLPSEPTPATKRTGPATSPRNSSGSHRAKLPRTFSRKGVRRLRNLLNKRTQESLRLPPAGTDPLRTRQLTFTMNLRPVSPPPHSSWLRLRWAISTSLAYPHYGARASPTTTSASPPSAPVVISGVASSAKAFSCISTTPPPLTTTSTRPSTRTSFWPDPPQFRTRSMSHSHSSLTRNLAI